MEGTIEDLIFKRPEKYAKILIRCPKCKGEYYIRAEMGKGFEIIPPDFHQVCQLCKRKVILKEQ